MAASDVHTNISKNTSQTVAWPQDQWWTAFRDPQLNQLMDQAIADSPNLKIAAARLRLAQQLANQAGTSLWPYLNATGTVAQQRFSQTSIYPPGFIPTNFTQTNVALNLTYDFDFWGKNREALNAAISETKANIADVAQAKLILTSSVAQIYFQIQADYARINIAERLLKQRQELLQLTQLQQTRGFASAIDYQQTKSDRDAIKVNLDQLKANLALDQHQLAALLGKNPETPITVKKASDTVTLNIPAVLPASLLARRPDITALRWRVDEALHNNNVAKAMFYPDINLSAAAGFETITFSQLFKYKSMMNNITPGLTLPIFDAGTLRANLGQKYAQYDQAVEQYNQQVVTAMREVADQVSLIRSIQNQQIAQQANLKATQKIYNLTDLRYKDGIDNRLNVMQAKIPYLTQEDLKIQLKTQRELAMIGLIKALGGGIS